MPIIYTEPKSPIIECDECALQAPLVLVEDEDNGFALTDESQITGAYHWDLPVGWVGAVYTVRQHNPDYATEKAEFAAEQREGLQTVIEQIPVEHRADASNEVEASIAAFEPESPTHYVQRVESVLCPKHAGLPQARLGVDEWDQYDGEGAE